MDDFQTSVGGWIAECFPPEVFEDRVERCDRFIEEALELTQACGYGADRAHALVDYVFARPKGDQRQEVGGTMVTLAALCNTFAIDLGYEARRELARVSEPETMAKIRAKQAAKPTGSALPIAMPDKVDTLTVIAKLSVRAEVALFALLMERELRANEHKGGWQDERIDALISSIHSQTSQLTVAAFGLLGCGGRNVELHRAAVIENAADVANFAMMVADVVGGLREPAASIGEQP